MKKPLITDIHNLKHNKIKTTKYANIFIREEKQA